MVEKNKKIEEDKEEEKKETTKEVNENQRATKEGSTEHKPTTEEPKEEEKKEVTKVEKKKPTKESVHVIPLRRAFEKPRTKMRNTAIKVIRDYIVKHTRKKPKISEEVSELIWKESKPPRKIKVKIVEEEETAIAELP